MIPGTFGWNCYWENVD